VTHALPMPAGVLSLLDESDPQLRVQALGILGTLVDDFGTEISIFIADKFEFRGGCVATETLKHDTYTHTHGHTHIHTHTHTHTQTDTQ
jgi:hypothetical protein